MKFCLSEKYGKLHDDTNYNCNYFALLTALLNKQQIKACIPGRISNVTHYMFIGTKTISSENCRVQLNTHFMSNIFFHNFYGFRDNHSKQNLNFHTLLSAISKDLPRSMKYFLWVIMKGSFLQLECVGLHLSV